MGNICICTQAWQEQSRAERSKGKLDYNITRNRRQKQNRSSLQNTVMIDSIYEKRFLPLEGVLEAIIVNIFLLPGIKILNKGHHVLSIFIQSLSFCCQTIYLMLHSETAKENFSEQKNKHCSQMS